jgi:hypothetical protein
MIDADRAQALDFLRSWPAKIAHVSTARSDGTTATVPVWYRIDDDDAMLIWTRHERRWVQRVASGGHLSFSVAEDAFPLRGAMGAGPAEVLGDGDIDVDAERAAIMRRYVLPFLVPAYEAARRDHRAIVRVRLDRLTGWTFDEG